MMLRNQNILSDCNWTQTQNHLVRKRTLNHLAKWLSICFWPNGWVLLYQLSGSGFESSCSHLNFRFCACFEQGVPWHSGNFRVWIHSETRTWHDKNIQSKHFIFLKKELHGLISFICFHFSYIWLLYLYKIAQIDTEGIHIWVHMNLFLSKKIKEQPKKNIIPTFAIETNLYNLKSADE